MCSVYAFVHFFRRFSIIYLDHSLEANANHFKMFVKLVIEGGVSVYEASGSQTTR